MTPGALIGLLLLAVPAAVAAQSPLRGRLLDASSGRSMACWSVFLLDSAGATRDSAVTGAVYYTFVVDTLGRVDPSSSFLVSASTRELARGAERGLARMRFAPWTSTPGTSCRRVVQSFLFDGAR